MKRSNKPPAGDINSEPILHTQLSIIEVAEPEILDELAADRRIGPLIATRLSGCVAIITPGKADQVINHMLKAGHTPKVITS
jgi:hypothetical protein